MLYSALAFLIGAGALYYARQLHQNIHAGRAWPTVPGRILERGVGAPMKAARRAYLPHVKYSYSVAGSDYTNDQVWLHRDTGHQKSKVQQLVDQLPDPVPVYYDPQDPTRSFLLVNPMSTVWMIGLAGAFALAMSLMHLVNWVAAP